MTMKIIIIIKLSYAVKFEIFDPTYFNLVFDTVNSITESINFNKETVFNNVKILPSYNKDRLFYGLPYASMEYVQNSIKPPFLGQPYSNIFYFKPLTIKILAIFVVFLSLLAYSLLIKIFLIGKYFITSYIITRPSGYNKHSSPYWQNMKKNINELGPRYGIPPILGGNTNGDGGNNGDDGNYNNNKGKGKVPFLFYSELMDIYNFLFTLLNEILTQLFVNNSRGIPANYFMDWYNRMTRTSDLALKYRHIDIVLRINLILDDLSDIHLNYPRDSSRERRIQVSQEILMSIARKVVLLMLDIEPHIYDKPF